MVNLRPLLYFTGEREGVRLQREAGEAPPWSKDPVFSQRLCNVSRSFDRVSSWLTRHVLTEQNISDGLKQFLEFSAWCRWNNWPPTIAKVMDAGFYPTKEIDWPKLGRFVDKLPGKKWTGAYMIAAPRKVKQKKGLFVARTVIRDSFRRATPQLIAAFGRTNGEKPTCEGIWNILRQREYFGSFMSGQVVGDWQYTSLLSDAPDRFEWAPMGPGSSRGFNRLMNRPLKTKIDPEEWKQKLGEWREVVIKHLNKKFGHGYDYLTALDVQNQLCETDKMVRMKLGEGRLRARYRSHEGLY